MPRCFVMASRTSVCLSDSCWISSLTSKSSKVELAIRNQEGFRLQLVNHHRHRVICNRVQEARETTGIENQRVKRDCLAFAELQGFQLIIGNLRTQNSHSMQNTLRYRYFNNSLKNTIQ
jgi:hypothetical protein